MHVIISSIIQWQDLENQGYCKCYNGGVTTWRWERKDKVNIVAENKSGNATCSVGGEGSWVMNTDD